MERGKVSKQTGLAVPGFGAREREEPPFLFYDGPRSTGKMGNCCYSGGGKLMKNILLKVLDS